MKIAILGYGVEGESVYNYYRAKYPDAEFTAYDNNPEPKNPLPEGIGFVGSVENFKGIAADIAIKTPAIPPWEVEVTGEVTSMTREFLKVCPAPVIGVTGTKGKGTTASLIKSILDAAGKKTWLVGNIGVGAFDVLDQISPNDIVVYELSSFQLWDADVSPHVAVILFIEQEHLDVHPTMDDYVAAKANIARHQRETDVVIYCNDNQYSQQIAAESKGYKISYPDASHAHVRDSKFYYGVHEICSVDTMAIKGAFNQTNACAAIDAAWLYTQDSTAIEAGLAAFAGLPHRLQFIREVAGARYYDDSIATTPGAAIAGLNAFDGHKVGIMGGSSKGSDFTELGQELAKLDVDVLLIGDEAAKIAASCEAAGFIRYEIVEDPTMEKIVRRAAELARPGSTVLLSPAAASFGLFKSYVDRGEQFTAAVQSL
jgi:UDP-N-acetylmuramoylalanine--D-glutamate ligase